MNVVPGTTTSQVVATKRRSERRARSAWTSKTRLAGGFCKDLLKGLQFHIAQVLPVEVGRHGGGRIGCRRRVFAVAELREREFDRGQVVRQDCVEAADDLDFVGRLSLSHSEKVFAALAL